MDAPLTEVVPVVPTIFHDDETVDLDGTARVADYLVDAEVDGMCLLANYSESWQGELRDPHTSRSPGSAWSRG